MNCRRCGTYAEELVKRLCQRCRELAAGPPPPIFTSQPVRDESTPDPAYTSTPPYPGGLL